MDKSIPEAGAYLLDFISVPESRGNYDTYNNNVQGKLPKKLTSMTLAEVLAINWKAIGARSTAAGRYQIIKDTLRSIITQLNLKLTLKFDKDLQDKMGFHLLKRRGYDAWTLGKIDNNEFAKRLAQEWASLPVLVGTRGSERNVKRGQSYYAGDGLNSHGVTADAFEDAIQYAKHHQDLFVLTQTHTKTSKKVATAVAAVGSVAGAGATVVAQDNAASLPDITTVTTVANFAKDAWLIGPLFGGIVLAAIVVGGVIWYRRG